MDKSMREENIDLVEDLISDESKIRFLREIKTIAPLKEGEVYEKLSVDNIADKLEYFTNNSILSNEDEEITIDEKRAVKLIEYAEKDWNPSNSGTKRAKTFDILSDCEWHCASCELPSSQPAKDIQQLRKKGFVFEGDCNMWGEYQYCDSCDSKTVHRRLKHPFPTKKRIDRKEMPSSFKTRVRKLYNQRDAFDRSTPSMTLEVDHRKPEVRWDEPEDFDFENMTDEEIKKHFQVLSRKNNLLKSRKCESCVKTSKRPKFMGIDYYYKGDKNYTDEVGCEGCGWYNPQKWRKSLNEEIKNS